MATKKEIASGLTADDFRKVFSYDRETGVFTYTRDVTTGLNGSRLLRKAGEVAGWKHNGYTFLTMNYQSFPAHRIAWLMETGSWPMGEIDHIDMDRSNNRISNLRDATGSQNRANSKPRSKWGYKGVGQAKLAKNVFFAQITHNGKHYYLGTYKTPLEAHEAYCAKARELHGEFARFE